MRAVIPTSPSSSKPLNRYTSNSTDIGDVSGVLFTGTTGTGVAAVVADVRLGAVLEAVAGEVPDCIRPLLKMTSVAAMKISGLMIPFAVGPREPAYVVSETVKVSASSLG